MSMSIFLSKEVEVPPQKREDVAELLGLPKNEALGIYHVDVLLKTFYGYDLAEFLELHLSDNDFMGSTEFTFGVTEVENFIKEVKTLEQEGFEQFDDNLEDIYEICEILENQIKKGASNFKIDLWY